MSELNENYYRPDKEQLEKIVPKQISMTELQNKINQQSIEIDNLNKEISRLRNEMMNLIQAGK